MSRHKSVAPSAARLTESLRDIGYDFPSAIADLVDNSVTAGAERVNVLIRFMGTDSTVMICDDGDGMSANGLTEALRFGSRRSYGKGDLGKYGLGLKTASLSQCRSMMVVSRRADDSPVSARELDLDTIIEFDDWLITSPNQRRLQPLLEALGSHRGTAAGTPIEGTDGLLNQMTKAVLERALQTEMTHHLGYERDDPAGHGTGNSRNGSSTKTVSTTNGPVAIAVPRDRNGEFEPRIVPKRARRIGQIDEMILSLYARGMSTRDIEAHLLEVYGVQASRELISNVTDVVADEVETWRARPVDKVYPIVYIDGIRIRVRDKGAVTIKVAHLAVGVDVEGRKHTLGLWIAEAEGAKFWHSVLTQLRNRGLRDILIACCDGLRDRKRITSV